MTTSYSPVLTTKAVKDETEQRILRDAHVRHLHTHKCTSPWRELIVWRELSMDPAICNMAWRHGHPTVLNFNVHLVGEGLCGHHAAADVPGEGGARGEGDRALGGRIRQRASQVSSCCNVWWWRGKTADPYFSKHSMKTISAEIRKTAEDRALQPSLQVDPTLPWPTTSTVQFHSPHISPVLASGL